MMAMNKYGGINDMPDGWTKENQLNKRIYMLWFGMLRRCYDTAQLTRKRGKTYSKVVVCERWFYLRNFVEDVQKLEGFNEWANGKISMALDKDFVAQEVTKIYSPSTCSFVTEVDNLREMNNRCGTIRTAQEASKTIYVLFKNDEYVLFDSEKEACEYLGVKQCSVAGAWRDKGKCKGWNVIRIGNSADMRQDDSGDAPNQPE